MDYSFVPGLATGDPALQNLNAALHLHPNMVVLSPVPDTLQEFFVNAQITDALVPSEDLILGTHALDEGLIAVAIDSVTQPPITYEKLQSATSIKLSPELSKPGTAFRIIGCLIGSHNSLPLLEMLKQALGNPTFVVAPKYIYSVMPALQGGAVESMQYNFRILSPTALTSRDAVKQAFQAGSNATPPRFVDVNGTRISPDQWDTWLPPAPQLQLQPATRHRINFPLKVDVPVTANVSIRADLPAGWIATRETGSVPHVNTGDDYNSVKSNQEQAQAGIPSDARFQSGPYPYHVRYFYDSPQSFIDNVHWVSSNYESGTTWELLWERYVYELHIPITEPPTNTLICNSYPPGVLSPYAAMFQGHSVDARLFATV